MLAAAATGLAALPYPINLLLSANPLPKGAAYACSGFASRGGVSHCDARRLRGQSTIEYVLLIAIVALVVIVAGPGVASAIRNQFGAVTGALGNGISKGDWEAGGSGTGSGTTSDADIYDLVNGTAFAVYSEDDHSLMFYKRRGVPSVGSMFNSRHVTEVFTGIETNSYDWKNPNAQVTDGLDTETTTPWYGIKDSILVIEVVDEGISPTSMFCWFANLLNVKSIDISKFKVKRGINCSWLCINCERLEKISLPNGLAPSNMSDIFYRCMNLTSEGLSMPGFDTSLCEKMWACFLGCSKLTSIPGIENWDTSKCKNFWHMFQECSKLKADLSEWDVAGDQNHANFNYYAPGVTLPKAWQ